MRQESADSPRNRRSSRNLRRIFGTLKIIEDQSWLGATDIGAIELDATSRDDIPAILIGLQAVWADEATRAERQCKRTQRERKPLHQFQPLRAA